MEEQFIRDRLSKLREEKQVSERKMSLDLGHSTSYIRGITSGRSLPSMSEFLYICEYLGMSSDCYKVTISSITYEVLFSYDNSYYTHCYHQTVKEYKSNGSLIRSKTDYYQAIGG